MSEGGAESDMDEVDKMKTSPASISPQTWSLGGTRESCFRCTLC